MTANPRPNNATPQRLHLPPHLVPRMPFSSPMGEEVMSPTTPNASRSPPQHQIQLSQNRSAEQENATLGSNRYEIPKPTSREWGSKDQKEKSVNKSRWPGLNVVTNFSKPPILVQKAADREKEGDTKQGQGSGLKRQENAGPLARSMTVESLGIRHQRSGTQTSLKPSMSKGRLGDLSRASSKWSNLSPSDRAVVIGISVSPEELAEHSASPQASAVESGGLNEQDALSRQPSIAPSIVITPAKDTAPWSVEAEDQVQEQRRRAASSVYSQLPPQNAGRIIDSDVVPPIPPLPPDAKKHNAQVTASDENHEKNSHAGVVSTCTVFDEDGAGETLMGARRRSNSQGSHLRIITKRGSMDTIATKHRSQGWWNHIISPFFPKSPMTYKFSSNTPTKAEIPASIPIQAADVSHDREARRSRRQSFPPRTTKSGEFGSPHTSWTDSSIDADFEKNGLAEDDRRETFISEEPQEMPEPDSAALLSKFEGFGLAAEYYEACLYDMHSATPFFECQNHVCLPLRTDSKSPPPIEEGPATRSIDAGPNKLFESPRGEQTHLPAVQQAPSNRFSAAFQEAITSGPRERPQSDATVIEDWDGTPVVQEAHVAPVVRAPEPVPAAQPPIPEPKPEPVRSIVETPKLAEATPRQPPAYSFPKRERTPKKYVAVMPPDRTPAPYETNYGQPMSPQPVTPVAEKQAAKDAIVMNEVRRKPLESCTMQGARDHKYQKQPEPEYARSEDQISVSDLYPPLRPGHKSPAPRAWEIREKELPPREPKSKSRGFATCRNCFGGAKPKNKKEKRILMAIAAGLVFLIILILVLCMTLTRKGNKTPVQSQWLNLTGYPPIPTGVSTIVEPNNILADSDCVEPSTMWSCALPKEEQQSIYPNAPNQPNFRVEILFQNGTNATSNATAANASDINKRSYGHIVNAVSAGSFIRSRLLLARNAFSSDTYSPSPSPPSLEDQTFLGNTTDGNAAPFDGEYTPFFMSFDAATKLSSRLLKRQSSTPNSSNNASSDPFPDPTNAIPPPSTNPDGTAASATLYPTPSAQPLRLYDRGLDTEHYGFYTYFDRSIFLKSSVPLNTSSNDTAPIPDDDNGGADENAASVRCTWAQTRFLVQIWTKKQGLATLLDPTPNTTSSSQTHSSGSQNATSLANSSANDFTQPGSFPYPVTITLDRHGGDINSKMIYCYGLDDQEHIVSSEKKIQLEDRAVGGHLANPALGPFGDVNVTTAQGGPGGIDGGSGGCGCKWVNWE